MTEPGPTTSVYVWGEEHRFRGASPELVAELAAFVDRKFREMQEARPSIDMKRLAVMVCMNLAEELYRETARREGLLRAVTERARGCRETLELVLPASESESLDGSAAGRHY